MPATVLIVDDDATFRALAARMLNAEGLTVVGEAADVGQGLAAAQALRPDAALVDVRLPDGDGIALAASWPGCHGRRASSSSRARRASRTPTARARTGRNCRSWPRRTSRALACTHCSAASSVHGVSDAMTHAGARRHRRGRRAHARGHRPAADRGGLRGGRPGRGRHGPPAQGAGAPAGRRGRRRTDAARADRTMGCGRRWSCARSARRSGCSCSRSTTRRATQST